MEELLITVTIANRVFKLAVDNNEEEYVRKAAKLIDEKVKEFAKTYVHKDLQDLLTMVALQYTTNAITLESKMNFKENELIDILNDITKRLDEHITAFNNC